MGAPKGNLFAKGHGSGRPAEFTDPDEIWKLALEYFEDIQDSKGKVKATITGLAFYLGFESRQSMYDYEKREVFSYVIKRLRLFVEHCYEQQLYTFNATGAIFALKNMGWKDKVETEVTNVEKVQDINYDDLTDEELKVLERVLAKSNKSDSV